MNCAAFVLAFAAKSRNGRSGDKSRFLTQFRGTSHAKPCPCLLTPFCTGCKACLHLLIPLCTGCKPCQRLLTPIYMGCKALSTLVDTILHGMQSPVHTPEYPFASREMCYYKRPLPRRSPLFPISGLCGKHPTKATPLNIYFIPYVCRKIILSLQGIKTSYAAKVLSILIIIGFRKVSETGEAETENNYEL